MADINQRCVSPDSIMRASYFEVVFCRGRLNFDTIEELLEENHTPYEGLEAEGDVVRVEMELSDITFSDVLDEFWSVFGPPEQHGLPYEYRIYFPEEKRILPPSHVHDRLQQHCHDLPVGVRHVKIHTQFTWSHGH